MLSQAGTTAGCVSSTGNSGACATGNGLGAPYDVVVSPDNANVYIAAPTTASVAAFSRTPGATAITQLSGTAGCVSSAGATGCATGVALTQAQGVAISPDGQDVYATGFNDAALDVFRRNSDGSLTQWPATRGCISNSGNSGSCVVGKGLAGGHRVAVSPDGRDVYEGGTNNTSTGWITVFARTH